MTPLYAHCPYCGFPVVVNGIERVIPRRCRQCREEYTPGVPLRRNQAATREGRSVAVEHQRATLRARIKQRRRSLQ